MNDDYDAEKRDQYLEQTRRTAELQKTDPIRALEEMQILAEKGSVNGMLFLGRAYQKARGASVDLKLSEKWYRRALERGSKQASLYLGAIYWNQKDYAKSYEAFSTGAKMDYAPAIYWLGRHYRDGLGVDRQPDKARLLFEQASAKGNLIAEGAVARLLVSGRFGFSGILKGLYRFFRVHKNAVVACWKDELHERFRH